MNLSRSLIKEFQNLIEEEAYELKQQQHQASSPQSQSQSHVDHEVQSQESDIDEETTHFSAESKQRTRRKGRLHPIQKAIIFSEVLKKPRGF